MTIRCRFWTIRFLWNLMLFHVSGANEEEHSFSTSLFSSTIRFAPGQTIPRPISRIDDSSRFAINEDSISLAASTKITAPIVRKGKGSDSEDYDEYDSADGFPYYSPTDPPTRETPGNSGNNSGENSNGNGSGNGNGNGSDNNGDGGISFTPRPTPGPLGAQGRPSNSRAPTSSPTRTPSIEPTITAAPTPIHISCEAAEAGDVYATSRSQIVNLEYELLTQIDASVSDIMQSLDVQFREFLASSLVNCAEAEASTVQGMDVAEQGMVIPGRECTNIQFFDADESTCSVGISSMIVYLSDLSSVAAAVSSQDIENQVYRTLRDAINGPNNQRQLRMRLLFSSDFTNSDSGILDLFFLNEPSRVADGLNRSFGSNNAESGLGEAGAVSLIAVAFFAIGIFGLIMLRRWRNNHDEESTIQKHTVLSPVQRSNNHFYQRSIHTPEHLGETFLDGIEAQVEPTTPSQLTYTIEGENGDHETASGGMPSTALFEAYEATPACDGDHIYHQTESKSRRAWGPESRSFTQEVAWVSPEKSSELNQSDELLVQPPPFVSEIPRSAFRPPSRRRSSQKKRYVSRSSSLKKKIPSSISRRGKSQDPPPSTRKPYYLDLDDQPIEEKDLIVRDITEREDTVTTGNSRRSPVRSRSMGTLISRRSLEYTDPGSTYKSKTLKSSSIGNDDSFSLTGFLNGNCGVIQDYYDPDQRNNKQKQQHQNQKQEKSKEERGKKSSPRTILDFWTDDVPSPDAAMQRSHPRHTEEKTYQSSIDLWTSQCDENALLQVEKNDHKYYRQEQLAGEATNPGNSNVRLTTKFSPYGSEPKTNGFFSPYGTNNSSNDLGVIDFITKNAAVCCTPDTMDLSMDDTPTNSRGRNRTPVKMSTNANRRRRSMTPNSVNRLPRNPPGRHESQSNERMLSYDVRGIPKKDSFMKNGSTFYSSRGNDSPYMTSSRLRGAKSPHSVYANNVVQL